ncbi:hypothetical protein SPI_00576 [Niveomyces insectorum RCEF 264]|uniref:Uncharacterized protein n=1 Tax=Niveomyces insectorum RCEF 264 TaxID=1081102 RepID=A0A168A8A0_9HYPO|nr:hypothetical protein SPI_00576 [Niveomyces insectorum RCEF 264]
MADDEQRPYKGGNTASAMPNHHALDTKQAPAPFSALEATGLTASFVPAAASLECALTSSTPSTASASELLQQPQEPDAAQHHRRSSAAAAGPSNRRRADHTRSNTWQASSNPHPSAASHGSHESHGSHGSSGSHGRPRPNIAAEVRTLEQIQIEHQYLFVGLHRQDTRIRTLYWSLFAVQAQLPLAQTPAEARKLRKDAGFAQSKIANAEQQERAILLRLGDVCAELQSRHRLTQLEQQWQQLMVAPAANQAYASVPLPLHTPPCAATVPATTPHEGIGDQATPLPFPLIISPFTPQAFNSVLPANDSPSGSGGYEDFPSPMSPLAPVFQPKSHVFKTDKSIVTTPEPGVPTSPLTASSVAKVGTPTATANDHTKPAPDDVKQRQAGELPVPTEPQQVFDAAAETPSCKDTSSQEVTVRRRWSLGAAQSPQAKQKRMSLPPLRFVWPGDAS